MFFPSVSTLPLIWVISMRSIAYSIFNMHRDPTYWGPTGMSTS